MLSLPYTVYDRILLCLFLVFLTFFWAFLSFQIHPKIKELETTRSTITGDRLKLLQLDKQINQLRREYMSSQENQFFESMQLDLELEEKIKALAENEKLTAKAVRE